MARRVPLAWAHWAGCPPRWRDHPPLPFAVASSSTFVDAFVFASQWLEEAFGMIALPLGPWAPDHLLEFEPGTSVDDASASLAFASLLADPSFLAGELP